MFCIHCGKENPDGSKFCIHCGKAITLVIEEEEPTPTARTKSSTEVEQGEESIWDAFKELVAMLKEAFFDEDGLHRDDPICPFCGEADCTPVQKNETTINNKNYSFGSGCCGMLCLGPFGLLCGMCGTGSTVKTTNELWWICKKCGKQHLSMDSAFEKWDTSVSGLPGTGFSMGVTFIIIKWVANEILTGLLSEFLSLFAWGVLFAPILGLVAMHQEISEGIGDQLLNYLSAEQKRRCAIQGVLSVVVALIVGIFGVPLLAAILSE